MNESDAQVRQELVFRVIGDSITHEERLRLDALAQAVLFNHGGFVEKSAEKVIQDAEVFLAYLYPDRGRSE